MNILVAFKALFWCVRKIDCGAEFPRGNRRSDGCGFVARRTSRVLMRAFQGEFRRSVIEAAELFPIPGVVASLAGLFGGMRIRMAAGARLIGEMILPGSGRRRSGDMGGAGIVHVGQSFVAVRAQHCGVSVDE